jgi:hypothetical protein
MELYFRPCYQAMPMPRTTPKWTCNTWRCPLAALALLALACSSDPDLTTAFDPNQPGVPPEPGAGPGNIPGDVAAEVPPGGSAAAPGSSPPPVGAPLSSPSGSSPPPAPDPAAGNGNPNPNATETNFFSAGCRSDADCGDRRCEFPPPDPDAGVATEADAAADAAAAEPIAPRGRCVARS